MAAVANTPAVKAPRAPSDFNKFMVMRTAELKTEQDTLNHKERFSLAANEWKAMDADTKAETIARAQEYYSALPPKPPKAPRKKRASKKDSDESATKEKKTRKPRAATPFNQFMSMRLNQLKVSQPNDTHKERFAAAAAEWKALDATEKEAAIKKAEAYATANPSTKKAKTEPAPAAPKEQPEEKKPEVPAKKPAAKKDAKAKPAEEPAKPAEKEKAPRKPRAKKPAAAAPKPEEVAEEEDDE